MSIARSSAAYQEAEVLSSSPERLVPVLYEHLLVSLKRGAMHIRKGDIEGKFVSLAKASDIIAELVASLDHEAGGEIAARLAGLYGFWLKEIGAAGRALDDARLLRVADMVSSLLDGWRDAVKAIESGAVGTLPSGLA
jgi:flagellar protein FliS